MMITIDLSPEQEENLKREAAEHGQSPIDYARVLLAEGLAKGRMPEGPAALESISVPGGVQQRSPAALLALAAEQGVKPVERFEDRVPSGHGDFWPEDESVDDFIKARRQWQFEGAPGFPWDEHAHEGSHDPGKP